MDSVRNDRSAVTDDRAVGAHSNLPVHGPSRSPPRFLLAGRRQYPVRAAGRRLASTRKPMAQYVFTMNRVGKIVPPKRQILKDISLSFFPGAKIGVLGRNAAGKSRLLKIRPGIDKDIEGEPTPMPNLKIGYLPQE